MNRLLLLTYMDVLETRNFNRTAERLNITQSTVSARIRQLEDDLGTRLFERGRGGAEPTAAGRRFEPHCRSFLAAWTLAKRDVSAAPTIRPRLRISVQFSLAKTVLVEWAQRMRAEEPRLDFYLESNFTEQIQRDILSGDLDIGIVFAPQTYPDIHMSEFGSERYVMVSTDTTHINTLDWTRYVKVAYNAFFDRQHDELFPDLTQTRTVVGSEDLAITFLQSDGGSAYLPGLSLAGVMAANPALQLVQDAPTIPQPIYSILHSRKRHDALSNQALAVLEAILEENSIG